MGKVKSSGRGAVARYEPIIPPAELSQGAAEALTDSPKAETVSITADLCAARNGQWLDADELKQRALELFSNVSSAGSIPDSSGGTALRNLTVDVGTVDHLEASALQVLIAIRAKLQQENRTLQLLNSSAQLQQWFDFAGAGDLVPSHGNELAVLTPKES